MEGSDPRDRAPPWDHRIPDRPASGRRANGCAPAGGRSVGSEPGAGGNDRGVSTGDRNAALQDRELVLTGAFRYANTWPTAIALVAAGRVDLDALVTGHYGLDDVGDALTAGRRDPTTVKAMVRP